MIRTQPALNAKSCWRQAFFLGLAAAFVLFLPFVIRDGGYFTYYGDFNVQQIPFYRLAHEAVRSGDVLWNQYTDLGVSFIGSYSFYLLFSPFFWLTLPFPGEAVPFLMAPLLVLKTGCASLTAYLYLERFVRDRRAAVVGGLLYACSGWMLFNVFFNHFHDVAVFFPLLLLGLEQLVCDGRRGFFALMVALNAMVNYWFFVGEVVFVILYVLVRTLSGDWPMTFRKFLLLAWEAVLGVGLAAAVLLPSVLAILGNPRTGPDELLYGWRLWLYHHEQRIPAILQSLFFPPELPARPNFFPDHGAKWASLSGWLPLFGMAGVTAFFLGSGPRWLRRMLAVCLLFALVPGLNSLFILMNNSYYARWFYMPVLLLSLATVHALEDSAASSLSFRRAMGWCLAVITLYVVMCGVTPVLRDGELSFGLVSNPFLFWTYAVVAVVCLAVTCLLVLYLRHTRRFYALVSGGVALCFTAFGIFYIDSGRSHSERTSFLIDNAIKGWESIDLPNRDVFVRTDFYETLDNLAMFWRLPSIQAFHSIVPPSIMEFYPAMGVKRDVGSRPEADYYALRPLLSVRWLMIPRSIQEQEPMPGYTWFGEQRGFHIYENDNWLPMGFGYRHYINRYQLEEVEEALRSNLLLRAIVLEDDDAGRYGDLFTWLDTNDPPELTPETMAEDVAQRRLQAADRFAFDRRGFSAHSSLEEDTLLFFSVPWDEGWSATVDGVSVDILRVNIGFMGVIVPAGDVDIRFDYTTPGLFTGAVISVGSLGAWLLYLLILRLLRRRQARRAPAPSMSAEDGVHLGWDRYLEEYGDREKRAARLQRTLNEASRRRIPDSIPETDRTLRFNPPQDAHNQNKEQN